MAESPEDQYLMPQFISTEAQSEINLIGRRYAISVSILYKYLYKMNKGARGAKIRT